MRFTEQEANFIKQLAKTPVNAPLEELAQLGELWNGIIEKIDALTERPHTDE